jgi:hypothetical protein
MPSSTSEVVVIGAGIGGLCRDALHTMPPTGGLTIRDHMLGRVAAR